MSKSKIPAADNPWDRAARLQLTRTNAVFGNPEPIDPGANFFVLALEALGAKTRFSCEGHPTGFYVAFEAPYDLAAKVKSAGFFSVEIEGQNQWSMRKTNAEWMPQKPHSEADKAQILRWAADAWVARFGADLMKSDELCAVLDAGPAPAEEAQAAPARRAAKPR